MESQLTLEHKLNNAFTDLKVYQRDIENLKRSLNIIGDYSQDLKDHSIRVALKASRLAKHIDLDQQIYAPARDKRERRALERAALFAGILHDIGKKDFPKGFFDKYDFTEEEKILQRRHVINSYNYVLGMDYKLTAEMVLRHHFFENPPYPSNEEIPQVSIEVFEDHRTLYYATANSRILAVADHHDAAKYRFNARNNGGTLSEKEIKKMLLNDFPVMAPKIEKIYKLSLFEDL